MNKKEKEMHLSVHNTLEYSASTLRVYIYLRERKHAKLENLGQDFHSQKEEVCLMLNMIFDFLF
jgi:hypothetical protein